MRISVIVPVYSGAATLPRCLRALAQSSHDFLELIVVDDGSNDETPALAREAGARVISSQERRGPAAARNLGARHASGELLLFVDADVEVHADTLGRIAERFAAEPDLDTLIGAYDDAPADPGLVSQFKNLMHSFTHQQGNRQASTFWCGCGAAKREVYLAHGGLDESYQWPGIEDIEFGYRLLRSGRKLALDPEIRCKHLKTWTLWNLIHADVFRRGIPWTELILRTRFLPNDLNLRWSQRICVSLAGLIAVLGIWGVSLALGQRSLASSGPWAAAILALVTAIVAVNHRFYVFLVFRRGFGFALRTVPLLVLYYFYSGISFVLGIVRHLGTTLLAGRRPKSSLPAPSPRATSKTAV